MAQEPQRGRFVPAVTDGEIIDVDNQTGEDSDEQKAFKDFRNSLNAGEGMATLRVSFIPKSEVTGHPTNAKSIFCFAVPIDRYDYEELLEFIQTHYGGGLYRLVGVIKGKQGAAFNRLVEIREPLMNPKKTDGGQSAGVGNIMDSVGRLILESQARTEALFSRLTPQVQQADPFAYMERMVTMLATIGVVGNKGAAAPPSDLLGEIKKIAEIRSTLRELGGLGGGSDEDEDERPRGRSGTNAYDLLGKTIENFGPAVLAAINQNKVNALPAVNAKPAPAIQPMKSPAAPGPVTIEQPTENPMEALRPQIETLVGNAKRAAPTAMLAQSIIAMTPEDRLADLHSFIGAPDSVARMALVVPEVNLYANWFESLRTELLAALKPAAASDLQPETEVATVPPAAT